MSAVKPPTAKQAKETLQRRAALFAALIGRTEGSSRSLALSYALPLEQVKSVMRNSGVKDNG